MEWSQDKTLFFIDLYRNKPILWDPQDPQHYNKLKKHDAWQQLADEVETTVEECKRKMTSLLASLRREKAKISKIRGTGKGTEETYKSSWFAFKTLGFVLDRNNPRSTMDTIEINNDNEKDDNRTEEVGVTTNEPVEINSMVRNPNISNDNESHPPRSKKAKKVTTDDMMTDAFTILKKASQKSETTRTVIDECDSYGFFVSNKLRNYSRSTRNIVQQHVSNILFNADQGRYDSVLERMDSRYEYGYGKSHNHSSHSSTSTYVPTPSPQPSQQNLGEHSEYNHSYLSGEREQSVGYMVASAIVHPSRSCTTTFLPSQTSSQVTHTQEEHNQLSPGLDDDFLDLTT